MMTRRLRYVEQFILVVLLLALAAVSAPAQIASLPPPLIGAIDRAIVQIHVSRNVEGGPVQGAGSGMIIDSTGLVLTAAHVVDEANALLVQLYDGQSFRAQTIGEDRVFDTALLRIEGQRLPAVTLGTSADVRRGHPVAAFGRSKPHRQFGPTLGTITDEDIETRPGVPHLRSTAIVWPGDSGGALVNNRGEVIGMTVAVTASYRDWMSSFSLSIDAIKSVLGDLRSGRVRHPWTGIVGATITEKLAQEMNLADRSGVLILEVADGSPAALAGLRGARSASSPGGARGDVITGVDGQPVISFGALASYILGKRIGDTVALEISREGRAIAVPIVLDAL